MKNQFRSCISFSLFVLIITLWSSYSIAQFSGIGIETGPGARILFGNEVLKQLQRPAMGFAFGVQTEYRLNDRLSLRSGFYYELKGGQSRLYTADPNQVNMIIIRRGGTPPSQSGDPISFRTRDNFNFITLPVLFKMKLGIERRWYLNAGASVGYLMGVRVVTLIKDGDTRRNKSHNDFYSIEYAALFGVGYERAINTKWNVNFEIRNHLGLNNLLDAPIIVGNGSLQTNSCYLLAGLTYRLPATQ